MKTQATEKDNFIRNMEHSRPFQQNQRNTNRNLIYESQFGSPYRNEKEGTRNGKSSASTITSMVEYRKKILPNNEYQ